MDDIKRLLWPLAARWAWLMKTPGRTLERGKKEKLTYLFSWLLPVMPPLYVNFIPQLNITSSLMAALSRRPCPARYQALMLLAPRHTTNLPTL